VIVQPTPLVPRDKDRDALPQIAPHDRVHDVRNPVVRVLRAERRMIRELEARCDPRDGRERPRLDVSEQVVHGPDVLVPELPVLVDGADRGVGLPHVAGLIRVGRIRGPVDVTSGELLTDRGEVEARLMLPDRSVCPSHIHENALPVRVAPPALEYPAVVQPFGLDVLRIVDRPARLTGDEEEMVGVRGARDGREHVVAKDEFPGPMPVVGDVARGELRVREVRSVVADREPVHLPAVVRGLPRIEAVGEVSGKPLRAADQWGLLTPSDTHAGPASASEPAEQVVEAAVLEHEIDDVLDRPPGLDAPWGTSERWPWRRRGRHALAEARGKE
jgi:hypothetical protein